MSEFQLGLLGIGLTVVVAVMAFNKWQEIRYRRQSEASIKSGHADVLFTADAPAEPSSYEQHLARDGAEIFGETAAVEEPGISGVIAKGGRSQAESSKLSKTINLLSVIDAPSGMTANELATAGLSSSMAGRIGVEALADGLCVPPVDDVSYTQLQVGLQLVNRQGPLSREDLESFAVWLGEIATRCGAVVTPLDLDAARQEAVNLDSFCGEVDIQIAVHVVSVNAPFRGTRIRAIAEAAGLVLEPDGRFRKRDEDGRELFRLVNEGEAAFSVEIMRDLATASVILEFDVARSPGGTHSFAKFRQFTEHLASGLGGRIVDDNRRPLDGAGFDAIARELAGIYQAMAARGILPGSPDSLRLFA